MYPAHRHGLSSSRDNGAMRQEPSAKAIEPNYDEHPERFRLARLVLDQHARVADPHRYSIGDEGCRFLSICTPGGGSRTWSGG